MEGLPRASHSGDRRAVNRVEDRAEQVAYRPEGQRVAPEAPSMPRRSVEPQLPKDKKSLNMFWLVASITLFVVVLGLIGWTVISSNNKSDTGIDPSKYQSVHLMDGKIYFGKLSVQNDQSLKLTNVYYLEIPEVDATTQANTTANTNPSLVRLNKAIYGPSDEMIIAKSQVLFFQNLKSDGRGAQLMDNDK
jgi:hypothetical protein